MRTRRVRENLRVAWKFPFSCHVRWELWVTQAFNSWLPAYLGILDLERTRRMKNFCTKPRRSMNLTCDAVAHTPLAGFPPSADACL
jgi:hypothetical protein